MTDFSGHAPASLQYRPRPGGWVLFGLADKGKQVALVEQGAHAARDGSLVAVFQAAHVPAAVTVTRAGGAVEAPPVEVVPDRLVLVDKNGNNFSVPVRDPSTGHGTFVDVFFYPDSPSVQDLRPLTDLADFPPGRTRHPDWKPAA